MRRAMPTQRVITTLGLLTALLCTACIRAPVDEADWPDELPPIRYYQDAYAQDQGNREIQPFESYLNWVRRFYQGWKLYPDGWLSTSRDIVHGIDDPDAKQRLDAKLAELGKLISAEWAKNSADRAIRSRELSVWGQALLKSVNNDEEEHLVDRISGDVNALLAGRLEPTDIELQRYYDVSTDAYYPD